MHHKKAVFGLNFYGRQLVRKFLLENTHIDCIIDDDPEQSGQYFCDIPILNLEGSIALGVQEFYLVGRYANLQEKQLLQHNIDLSFMYHVPRSSIAITGSDLAYRSNLTAVFLKTVSQLSREYGHEIWLDCSGLLAAARGQSLGSLSDVDLLITKGDIVQFAASLSSARNDWNVTTKLKKSDELSTSEIFITGLGGADDKVEPPWIHIREKNLNPLLKRNRYLVEQHFTDSGLYLNDTKIKFPKNYEDYLTCLYGVDWRTPDDFYRI